MEQNQALGTYEQNPYASGAKRYGMNASSAPTSGPVDKSGYVQRDAENERKKQVYLSWMQNNSVGAHNSPGALRKPSAPGPIPPIMTKPISGDTRKTIMPVPDYRNPRPIQTPITPPMPGGITHGIMPFPGWR